MTLATDEWRPSASMDALRLRAEILAKIRTFFAEREVMEVETPLLASAPVTDLHLHALSCRYRGPGADEGRVLYLQTSPDAARSGTAKRAGATTPSSPSSSGIGPVGTTTG